MRATGGVGRGRGPGVIETGEEAVKKLAVVVLAIEWSVLLDGHGFLVAGYVLPVRKLEGGRGGARAYCAACVVEDGGGGLEELNLKTRS